MQTPKPLLSRKVLLILGILLIGMTAATAAVLHTDSSSTAFDDKASAAAVPSSSFSFVASKATGWRQGPSNKTSMALFKNDSDCFVSADIRNGAVDEAEALSQIATDLRAAGYTVTASDTISTVFSNSTDAQPVAYTLHQYTVSGAGSSDGPYKMQVFGYVPLDQRYIRVQAYCDNNIPLSQIRDAALAITLDAKQ